VVISRSVESRGLYNVVMLTRRRSKGKVSYEMGVEREEVKFMFRTVEIGGIVEVGRNLA